jgi:hypothetical protein
LLLGVSILGRLAGLSGVLELLETNEYFLLAILAIVEIIVVFLSFLALNGFITKSYYYRRSFWVAFFYVFIISSLYNVYDVFANMNYTNSELLSFLVVVVSNNIQASNILIFLDSVEYGLVFPVLYAIYKYSFSSPSNWVVHERT